MKLFSVLTIILFTSFSLSAQNVEYSEIHWGLNNAVNKRLHIKDIVKFEGIDQEELKDRTDRWLDLQLSKDKVFEWRMGEGSSKQSWFLAQGEPYDVDGSHRIWTKYMVCNECIKTFKNSKFGSEGHYRIDFRFKNGKLLMVMSSFNSSGDNTNVEDWMVTKGELTIDPSDPRATALVEYFNLVKEDLKTFIETAGKKQDIDNW
jgi:hypothetical protein